MFRSSFHITGALVKFCQTPRQICRVAFLGRHFFETAGDFPQRLRPTGGGVCHQGNAVAHIAVIFCNGNTGVDAGFAPATGILDVLAISTVRSIRGRPERGSTRCGNSCSTSVISLPRSPQPM